jgi:hypothetical protein
VIPDPKTARRAQSPQQSRPCGSCVEVEALTPARYSESEQDVSNSRSPMPPLIIVGQSPEGRLVERLSANVSCAPVVENAFATRNEGALSCDHGALRHRCCSQFRRVNHGGAAHVFEHVYRDLEHSAEGHRDTPLLSKRLPCWVILACAGTTAA